MKEIYAERIIKDDGLFRALFEIVWNNRKNEEPETFHPDYIETKRAMERVLNSEAEETQADLWRIIRCFSETYYLMGLREGANMIHTLLPAMNVHNDSFGSNNASPAEIGQLQFLLKQLVELDPAKKELVDRIEEKTSNYTNLSKKACSSLSEAVDAMIKNIEKALEELGGVLNMISQKRMNSFCRELIRRVRRYYSDKEHRKEFEEWYLQKYGKPYEWKKISTKDKEE